MISAKSKTSHIKTVFTYSHANTPLSQSERAYYLSYFIKCSGTYYIASGTILVINIRSIGPITCFVLSARKHFKTSLNIKSPHVRESTKLLFFSLGRGGRGGRKNPEILGFGIPNPTEDWNRESKFQWQRSGIKYRVPGTRSPRSGIQNTRLHWIPCLMGLIEGPINHTRKSKTAVITCQLKKKPSGWHQAFKENNCVCNHSRWTESRTWLCAGG